MLPASEPFLLMKRASHYPYAPSQFGSEALYSMCRLMWKSEVIQYFDCAAKSLGGRGSPKEPINLSWFVRYRYFGYLI